MRREVIWTPPRVGCDTELWHAADNMATEDEVGDLVAALARALRARFVLETGTYLGHTAAKIVRVLAEHNGHLYTIEKDADSHRLAASALRGWPATAIHGDSLTWDPATSFDLMFFDSDIETREAEMIRYRGWASKRCVWALHDTRDKRLRAVLDRLWDQGVIAPFLELDTPRGITIGSFG